MGNRGSMDTKQQIQDWSTLYGKPISETEYREISQNLGAFFSILKEWDDKEKMRLEDERNYALRNPNNPR